MKTILVILGISLITVLIGVFLKLKKKSLLALFAVLIILGSIPSVQVQFLTYVDPNYLKLKEYRAELSKIVESQSDIRFKYMSSMTMEQRVLNGKYQLNEIELFKMNRLKLDLISKDERICQKLSQGKMRFFELSLAMKSLGETTFQNWMNLEAKAFLIKSDNLDINPYAWKKSLIDLSKNNLSDKAYNRLVKFLSSEGQDVDSCWSYKTILKLIDKNKDNKSLNILTGLLKY